MFYIWIIPMNYYEVLFPLTLTIPDVYMTFLYT